MCEGCKYLDLKGNCMLPQLSFEGVVKKYPEDSKCKKRKNKIKFLFSEGDYNMYISECLIYNLKLINELLDTIRISYHLLDEEDKQFIEERIQSLFSDECNFF